MAGTTRRRFDPEFRAGAVRIVKETGKPVSHVARDLGINEYTLHNWVQMDRHANGQAGGNSGGGGTLKESESEELARLRREKAELVKEHAREKAAWEKERAELEDERDVLKRSVVLWVKEAMGR
ncbi:transposase [Microtetraspora fusca]|uniref:Transposase n=1 Tax=Microtetraspora fusca TaxID=1997 RepID=A0ABW6VJS4_MICFU|nr:transposase [Microtetraspora malaysiensis]